MSNNEDGSSFSDSLSSSNNRPRKKATKPKAKKSDKNVNDLIRDALSNYLLHNNVKVYKEDCAKATAATLQEFLQAFILIGYDFQGTPIKIIHAHNGQEADALSCALQKFMMQTMRLNDDLD